MSKQPKAKAEDVAPIVKQVGRLLAGHLPALQSAVLADLLAMYLAGHIVRDDPAQTDALRADLLQMHVDLVHELLPVNAAQIHGERP